MGVRAAIETPFAEVGLPTRALGVEAQTPLRVVEAPARWRGPTAELAREDLAVAVRPALVADINRFVRLHRGARKQPKTAC